MSAYRELATRRVALRQRIEDLGDADLMALMEETDLLRMNSECTREIHSEWAEAARRIAPESLGCDCNTCAIGRALDKALAMGPLSPFTADRDGIEGALAYLADALMESGQEIGELIEARRREQYLHSSTADAKRLLSSPASSSAEGTTQP